jgi:hypothetical protein
MKNIIIVTGGNGTRVADALVRLLAVGFPTRMQGGLPTSAGDELEIWRIDPDRSAGALTVLNETLRRYRHLQHLMQTATASRRHRTRSRWQPARGQ